MDYSGWIEHLRNEKRRQTEEKMRVLGPRDEDDYGWVLPPEDFKAELPCRDDNGSWAGAAAWGRNFRWLMEHHPTYVDPHDALAGRWMFMMSRMRQGYRLELSNFAFDYSHLKPGQQKYDITCGIGKDAHFAPDYRIGLELGWGGLLAKVREAQRRFAADPVATELMLAEEEAILGVQAWIGHLADRAEELETHESDPDLKRNLREMARVNRKLVSAVPETLREVCQWLAHFNMASRVYNRDGAGGQLDELLRPYYEHDLAAGLIDDADAEFYILCLLLNDPHYYQLGGPDAEGKDHDLLPQKMRSFGST